MCPIKYYFFTIYLVTSLTSFDSAPTTTTCVPVDCTPPPCEPGLVVYDPQGCNCPTCRLDTTSAMTTPVSCPGHTCPDEPCEGLVIYPTTECGCPTCQDIPWSSPSTHDDRICSTACPVLPCGGEYELYEDITNCTCPTCQCAPRVCPDIVMICDPNNPPPPATPCGCRTTCIEPSTTTINFHYSTE